MPYFVSAEAAFSAAHTLPDGGACARVHGHNWRVRVTVQVAEDALDGSGMGLDFRQLEQLAQRAVAEFEHRMLNELEPFRDQPPSAEHLARVIFERVAAQLTQPGARVDEVALWEMPQYRVVYRPE